MGLSNRGIDSGKASYYRLLKKTWYELFSDHPYTYLGRFLWAISSNSYKARFYDEFFVKKGYLATFIQAELERQHYSKKEDEIRRFNREKFWGGKAGKKYHESKKEKYKSNLQEFLKGRDPLVTEIGDLLSSYPRFHTICEIGTGNGVFLYCLSRRFAHSVRNFVGIDLNKEQIMENKEAFKEKRLEFIHGEIADWINTKCEEGTIFVSYGTFEYFTQKELEELFELIGKKMGVAAIAMCETVNFALNREVVSKPRGGIAYSHSYPYLFRQCSYHIFREEERINPDTEFNNKITMVTTTFPVNLKVELC